MSQASDTIRRWREDPIAFVRECLKAEPDGWQADMLAAFPTHRRIGARASKGPGKTAVLSWMIWNFLVTRLHPKIACTSISGDNLSDGLWTELAKWQHNSPLLLSQFTWSKTRIVCKHHEETWWCSARNWSKGADSTQQADTLAGLHADNLMFVIDEVGSIPESVMVAAEAGLATGKDTKIVMAGNPTMTSGPLWRACTTDREQWHMTEITSDPDDPKRSSRVDVKWAKEQIERFGKENPWVLVNVFGRFRRRRSTPCSAPMTAPDRSSASARPAPTPTPPRSWASTWPASATTAR